MICFGYDVFANDFPISWLVTAIWRNRVFLLHTGFIWLFKSGDMRDNSNRSHLGVPDFKWVAVTWQQWHGTMRVTLTMTIGRNALFFSIIMQNDRHNLKYAAVGHAWSVRYMFWHSQWKPRWWDQQGVKILQNTGLVLGLRPANGRRRYKVTPSLIGWGQT